ncbi:putative laccase-9 [Oryza brachyantha]|uniref:putative laccase-9 n=1 Tax=Oryza brachyantha TaxID=4533 RepID=UPI001ADC9037|nr:putative laccase-9 [Oryza brachyantha]
MCTAKIPAVLWLLAGVVLALAVAVSATHGARTRHYDFFITETNYTRLCREKSILTVNGQYPGPTIYARKGDLVIVNVYNHGKKNITIHWHGVDQPQNPWSDGPEFITQCPIRPGGNFSYQVILSKEEGTLWWHAHSDFDRATVLGAIVIHPKRGTTFPFKRPDKEIPVILGEWWNRDVEDVLEEAKRTGGDVVPSDANTINGQPGDMFPCSRDGTFKVEVQQGKTYLLRVINAGLTNDMFFAVAGHRLTMVGIDARYTKPLAVDYIMIAPGQTMDVLLEASRTLGSNSRYYMAARTFITLPVDTIPSNNSTATAIVEYTDSAAARAGPPDFPILPAVKDMDAAMAFLMQLRSLGNKEHPVDVPTNVDEHMLIDLAINILPCDDTDVTNASCEGPQGSNKTRFAASLNNVSFVSPAIDVLDAYYYGIGRGVYEEDFPNKPAPVFVDLTGSNDGPGLTKRGTKVKVLEYGAVVEVVFQDTSEENHPMHLHGFAFYVVGRGSGKFDERRDPATYNLVDPPYQNTVSVPKAGWAAIRFRTDNPGVWFMHCHFDRHVVWGMNTVFIVKDGKTPEAQMLPRPPNMPMC